VPSRDHEFHVHLLDPGATRQALVGNPPKSRHGDSLFKTYGAASSDEA
jgi:hypothetical protein